MTCAGQQGCGWSSSRCWGCLQLPRLARRSPPDASKQVVASGCGLFCCDYLHIGFLSPVFLPDAAGQCAQPLDGSRRFDVKLHVAPSLPQIGFLGPAFFLTHLGKVHSLVAAASFLSNVRLIYLNSFLQIGFLGPAFFLTQLGKVHSPFAAVACMMASQGLDAFSQSGLYSNHQVHCCTADCNAFARWDRKPTRSGSPLVACCLKTCD